MYHLMIFSLILITNIKCETNCEKPEGCPEMEVTFEEPLRWCTVDKSETKQCQNVITTAAQQGYHNIECVQQISKAACLEAIRKGKADIVSVVNIPMGEYLEWIITTTSDENPVDITKVDDPSCIYKLYYNPDGSFQGYYRRQRWTCPSKHFIKVLCKSPQSTRCYYFNEIIMRMYDPNIEVVKQLVLELWSMYQIGDYIQNIDTNYGDLLFQGYTDKLYTVEDAEEDPPSTAARVVFVLVPLILSGVLLTIAVKMKFLKKATNPSQV